MRTVQTTRNKPFWRLSFPPKGRKIQECSDSCFGYQHCPAVNTVYEGLCFQTFPVHEAELPPPDFHHVAIVKGHRRHTSAFLLVPECVLKHPWGGCEAFVSYRWISILCVVLGHVSSSGPFHQWWLLHTFLVGFEIFHGGVGTLLFLLCWCKTFNLICVLDYAKPSI